MTETEKQKELIGQKIASNKYELTKFLASGSFSYVYIAKESKNGKEDLVVKLESMKAKNKRLSYEFAIYQLLRRECNHSGIPKTYFFGEFQTYHAMVLELLGPTLGVKFEECGGKFSVKTVTLLAIKMIDIFEYIHSRRVIFRDVKPENFVLGLPKTPKADKLHVIDFGLAKEYKDTNGVHIPYKEDVGITGTPRYVSINTHLYREQSRRDDMEAIGHLLVYFLKGQLPWMGVDMEEYTEKLAKIGEIKQNTKPEILCSQLPKEFPNYLKTVRSLKFTEEPNYKNFKEMFEKLLLNRGENLNETYDWTESKAKNKKKKTPKTISTIAMKEEK